MIQRHFVHSSLSSFWLGIGCVTKLDVLFCLDFSQIPEGKWFLQSAGNSELGIMMIALCKSRKIKTISIVRREDAAEQVRNAGYPPFFSCSSTVTRICLMDSSLCCVILRPILFQTNPSLVCHLWHASAI